MQKFVLLLLTFGLFPFAFSQVLEIRVLDENQHYVSGYTVVVNDSLKKINSKEKSMYFTIISNSKFEIKHPLFSSYEFKIYATNTAEDTIRRVITISSQYQDLDEVQIFGTKFNEIDNRENEFIIDYYPYLNEKTVLLTKYNNQCYLKLSKLSVTLDSTNLDLKASQIFIDALGNFFVIGNKKVMQFNIVEDKFVFQKRFDFESFERTLENAVALYKDYGIYVSFSMHNQLYSLIRVQNGKNESIYSFFEKEKYKRALYFYNRTVNYYMATIPEKDNLILMGIWDGDLMSLNSHPNTELEQVGINPNKEIMGMTSWSDKITSNPLSIETFGLIDQLVILNGENDSITHISYENLKISKEIASKTHLTGDYFFDYFYNQIYMIADKKGTKQIFKIDINTGDTKLIADLSEIHQPRNIKVINDQVYFLVLDKSGYNRLLKVN